jgi:hypothetical protein
MQPTNNSKHQVSLKPDQPNQNSSIDRLVQAFGRVWQTIKTVSHKLYAMVFRVNEVGTDVLSNKTIPSLPIKNDNEKEIGALPSQAEISTPATTPEIKPNLEDSEVTPGEHFDTIDWEYFDLINVEAQGDCQILAFMAGLEDKHSLLLRKTDGTKYTPEEIRKLEIDFIRSKIKGEETNNENKNDYILAVEMGLEEHNEEARKDAEKINDDATNPLHQEIQAQKYTYEFLLNDKDTPEADKTEYKRLLDALDTFEKPVFDKPPLKHFDNIDEYLNYLAEPKSYCSSANLMALSELFKVPIYLHVRSNEDQPVQMFNLSQSDLDPIHLHFSTSEKHYQLRLYNDQA